MDSNDERLRRLVLEIRVLEGTANTLQSRLNLVNAALSELRISIETLNGVEKETEDSSILVPIGAGSYVKAKLGSVDKVIVGAGAGVAIERSMEEARKKVENRIADMEKTRATIRNQLSQVMERMRSHRSTIEKLSLELSKQEEEKSV